MEREREGERETYIEADYGSGSIGVEGHCEGFGEVITDRMEKP